MRQECSFRQWISIYYDGEMDSHYKKEMENHIEGCADCAKQLAAYRNISNSLVPAEDELPEEAQRRVLQKLETSGVYSGYGNRPVWGPPIWKRRVSIPIPAAAAVVFMLIALALLWITRSPGKIQPVNMAITAETETIPGILPVSGMENVLQYLDGNDAGEIIILRLPESRKFASYGEPAIIKAADYSPNMPVRRKR
jgi:anti-sigma factor RsiW